MAGHNGWGATSGSGRLPRPRGEPFSIPRIDPIEAQMAIEARKLSAQLEMSVRDVLARLRKDGIADYDDETMERIAMLACM